MIPFNKPFFIENLTFNRDKISGDGYYSKEVTSWFQYNLDVNGFLLTTSCTDALEMTALLINISPGDEVIAPSFTFVSTVNAFALRGAKIVFVDIDPKTMNIDDSLIESAITSRTKAIVVVHYAGVACDMDQIIAIAERHNLVVVEDAAQAVMAKYNGEYLGTIGELGTYSFHETKNYTMGEGGALLINKKEFKERAEIIREKGTDRSKFLRGQIDKYSWVDIGSSFLPSDILAAYLYPQLLIAEEILSDRISTWKLYYEELKTIDNYIDLPFVPDYASHNAHMFYVKVKDIEERTTLITHLANDKIQAVFHYVPLHTSPAGRRFGRFNGVDKYTTKESERLLRLPIYYQMKREDVLSVCNSIKRYYGETFK
jgi:dTDP-4-amino-4,6-dideoxygalactose transaminase